MNVMLRRFLPLSFLLLFLGGCAGFIDYYFLPPAEDTAQEIYEAGRECMPLYRFTLRQRLKISVCSRLSTAYWRFSRRRSIAEQ